MNTGYDELRADVARLTAEVGALKREVREANRRYGEAVGAIHNTLRKSEEVISVMTSGAARAAREKREYREFIASQIGAFGTQRHTREVD